MKELIKTVQYPIYFHEQGYAELQKRLSELQGIYSNLFILADTRTYTLCLPRLIESIPVLQKARMLCIKTGEKEKNIENCLYIWRQLSQWRADRNSLMINLGGGVITDIGGFAASVFKRGISFINIPTTLLAMVDASIGGKTGIDLDHLKNEIGLFRYPEMVIIDEHYLKSLPERELKSGMAEIFKHGLIADKKLWQKMGKQPASRATSWNESIRTSNMIKSHVVSKDPYEKNGLRKILNFGHTIGHGIESHFLSTQAPLLHGEAIALGMVCEAWLSWKINGLPKSQYEEIAQRLLGIYPLKEIDESTSDKIVMHLHHDKKNFKGKIRFALLSKIGACTYDHEISIDLIRESFNTVLNKTHRD
ncbi:3-dehydroquinate synthase [Bacteroidetes bacterium endosymbiont of Geopemphigus sp.]|uniref:3-dehydroquinate synthase n=1 Tax=Bacteroidetes bacterium endosymbiont of Geopemphigus sp. TaxID=2047937 RepID=UPI001F4D6927|nr:3-dehydroquinate synthase [Bacteroidetes bacterium endosymbiont of Geopemphigus sp.]